jgi:hypothetical protein
VAKEVLEWKKEKINWISPSRNRPRRVSVKVGGNLVEKVLKKLWVTVDAAQELREVNHAVSGSKAGLHVTYPS